ncbi:Rid family hydrolase [Kineococcus rhizosphaerae]|uniref:Enamine deaminase RidA (YjgF/YER057c/UK114 family) n=1 Tax=Kineococcus rhizosphaerae TaxID=559628 RepID=A0A2T0QXN6_9ACTN|nr:Rid family hydrolase [Kineococcus rhizosphaerae]PRY10783.1 enamine deaminase RidA (YjgF/YER057c/UK114 family) [Kineococcus rhizosphaerae]
MTDATTPGRQNVSGGSPYEPVLGYSRAVKVGAQVFVAGTTAPGEDAAAQARAALATIAGALEQAGATLSDVVRTRVFLTDIADFDAVGAVHGEVFGDIRPAMAIVQVVALAGPDNKVEIEADAVIA